MFFRDLFFTLFSFLLIFLFFYFLYKKFKISPFLIRRLSHIISSIWVVLLSFKVGDHVIFIGSLLVIFLFLIGLNWKFFDFLDKKDRKVGIFTYVISITVASFLFLPLNQIFFIYLILILGVSDGLAGIGVYFSKNKKLGLKKTWAGSVLFAISSFFISIFMGFLIFESILFVFILSILITLALTFIERLSKGGWDNLTLTLFLSLVLFMLI